MPTDTRDPDWGPKLSNIDDPIADDEWEFEGPGGEKRKMRVIVGRPAALPGKTGTRRSRSRASRRVFALPTGWGQPTR